MSRSPKCWLTEPHSNITVEAERLNWAIMITYRGPSVDALHAAGCISAEIVERCKNPDKGKGRADADGDTWRRYKRPTKAFPDGVEINRYVANEEKANNLPGVMAALEHVRPRAIEQVAGAHFCERAEGFGIRNQGVGRFQRLAQWFNCENVIFINWTPIRVNAGVRRVLKDNPELAS